MIIKLITVLIIFPILVIIVLVSGIVLIQWICIIKRYKYNVKSDYNYNFDRNASIQTSVQITTNGFVWPDIETGWDTGFLKLSINSSLFGKFLNPSIEIQYEDLIIKQCFEHGLKGVRYVNISQLSSFNKIQGNKIYLKGCYMSWIPQNTELILFKNDNLGDERILVVAPHPDDAEMAAFGLYSYKDTFIATVTAGEAGEHKYKEIYTDKKIHYTAKGKLRVWDSITIPLLGGISPLRSFNMGYFDQTLERMYCNITKEVNSLYTQTSDINTFRQFNVSNMLPVESQKATWNNLISDFASILKKINPKVIVTTHPLLESNTDHQFASIALLKALKESDLENGKLYLYTTNYSTFTKHYPFGFSDSIVSLPPCFDNSNIIRNYYSHALSPDQQKEKIFVLEAMHDLRQTPPLSFKWLLNICRWRIEDWIMGIDNNIINKFVRPNELFYIIPFEESEDLVKQFWESRE